MKYIKQVISLVALILVVTSTFENNKQEVIREIIVKVNYSEWN